MATAVRDTFEEGQLNVLRRYSRDVIEAEVNTMAKRDVLEAMVRESVKAGLSIDSIAEATGMRTQEIRSISDKSQSDLGNLHL